MRIGRGKSAARYTCRRCLQPRDLSDSKSIEAVPWVVDTGRTNTGILLGSAADLAAACRQTAAESRATTRDMFPAAASGLV